MSDNKACKCCTNWYNAVGDLMNAYDRFRSGSVSNDAAFKWLEGYIDGVRSVSERFQRANGNHECRESQKVT